MFKGLTNALLVLMFVSPLAVQAQNPQGTQVDPATLAAIEQSELAVAAAVLIAGWILPRDRFRPHHSTRQA